ncbi:TetR/AcrR family transcriptional regulator [Nocardioides albidus]|uniref:TetR/AcrR family transcriptional regulator n=2 Tax=Nocardioides albidus TaxID=1517589 RepID=A0A5C4VLJ0_9ACTN|nr:TetR/AcrR family transcriptional regulator [Nocardioides albidus]
MGAVDDDHRERMRIEEFWHDRATDPRRRILVGATVAFAQRGYHGASTRQIAVASGMSPAAVYIHFESKEDLFFQISRAGHLAALDVLRTASEVSTDPAERLRHAVAAFAAIHAEFHVVIRTVQYELRVLSGERFQEIAAIRHDIVQAVREILQAGVKSGQFAVTDIEGTTLLVLSFCIDIARWYSESSRRTPSSIGLQYSDLALKLVDAGRPGGRAHE